MQYSDIACFHPKTFIYLPCWSVGRLMEIFDMCYCSEKDISEKWENHNALYKGQTYMDYIMYVYEHNYMFGNLNFSKLEEYFANPRLQFTI